MLTKRDALESAKSIIKNCLESWPYAPPENLDELYYECAARVMNTLDPDGVLIQKIIKRLNATTM